MKFRTFTLLLCAAFAVNALAQPEATVNKASVAPVIDGVIDEVWAEADAEHFIDQPYREEVPTLGASGDTYWKILWTGDGGNVEAVYVLIVANDDDFYPDYTSGTASWESDKPEIYFDVNFNLQDGQGPASGGSGHYQFAPAFPEGQISGELQTDGSGYTYAFQVNDPDYVGEYMIPTSLLLTGEGAQADFTENIGFDVTIIDRDELTNTRDRAVWANVGLIDECWSNMDDAGLLTFDGASALIWIDEITLTDVDPVIDENNGKMMLNYTVLPVDATESAIGWSLENGTGKAMIDPVTGEITAQLDGTVTVTAKSAYAEASVEVTISNQIVTIGDINLMRNGFMDDFDPATGTLDVWSSGFTNVEGEMYIPAPAGTANWWEGGAITGQSGFGLNTSDMYTLSFWMRSEAPDTFYVDFEDPANGYLRFGTTTAPEANGLSDGSGDGRSQWEFVTTVEGKHYEFDVTFPDWKDNTEERFNLMGGKHDEGGIFIDSIVFVNNADIDKLTPDYKPVELIEVSAAGDATTVALGETLQMSATVTPGDATLTDVRWMVEMGTGGASVDEAGLVTPDSVGTVMVKAMAKDDSKVYGMYELEVTFGVGVEDKSVSTLKVYPNPAVNVLNVVTEPNSSVAIYNSVGAKMDEAFVTTNEHRFNISSYPAGVYFVRNGNAIAKFVK